MKGSLGSVVGYAREAFGEMVNSSGSAGCGSGKLWASEGRERLRRRVLVTRAPQEVRKLYRRTLRLIECGPLRPSLVEWVRW